MTAAATASRPEVLRARAAAANHAGQARRALEICQMALNLHPEAALAADLHGERALAWLKLGRGPEAREQASAACALHGAARHQAVLGISLLEVGRFEEAADALTVATNSDPGRSDWWAALGRACLQSGRHAEAAGALRRALALAPVDRGVRLELARACAQGGRPAEAEEESRRLLAEDPDDVDANVLLGSLAQARGRTRRAMRFFARALKTDAGRSDAHYMLGIQRLQESGCRAREGWAGYEWRQPSAGDGRRMGVPAWRGEPLAGKRLVVWCEQGYGDNLQFVRFIPLARARGADTVYIAPPSLVRLFRQTSALGTVVAREPPYPGGDFQTLVMSLPHRLGLASPFEASAHPYLQVESARRARWQGRLGGGFKVALAWQGNPRYAGDGPRSMPLRFHVPLLRRLRDEVRFFSLQKYEGREQLRALPADLSFDEASHPRWPIASARVDLAGVIDVDTPGARDAFVDTAAIVTLMDLIITTDTAIAHLAGALGSPVWLLLSAGPDFRWGKRRARTDWYPHMRIFRQRRAGDWAEVIQRVSDALEHLASAL